jgi:CDP-glucose 4,6-dehydratase
MESVGIMFDNIYQGRRVLITGHTGFKGSWLSLWLKKLGAEISCIALPADTEPNHWQLLDLDIDNDAIDIRNTASVREHIEDFQPEIVFHLAAQALVRHSYANPLDTWSSNVMGTANVLDACRQTTSVKAIVVVTTDKCYQNEECPEGYQEHHQLGGHDPYSASKAATELLVASYRDAFLTEQQVLVATARAGNVIGGGDWSEDRLIPDIVRSMQNNETVLIRSPHAIRPWQHVLESLSGYLLLGKALLQQQHWAATSWNFGPESNGEDSVANVLNQFNSFWPELEWKSTEATLHETNTLRLNSQKARAELNWQPVLALPEAIEYTARWYLDYMLNNTVRSEQQIDSYVELARSYGVSWTI